MTLKEYITRPIDRVLSGVSATVGAIGLSQVPNYIAQYTQNLFGHVGEAARNVAGWKDIAVKTTQGSLDTLVSIYSNSGRGI